MSGWKKVAVTLAQSEKCTCTLFTVATETWEEMAEGAFLIKCASRGSSGDAAGAASRGENRPENCVRVDVCV